MAIVAKQTGDRLALHFEGLVGANESPALRRMLIEAVRCGRRLVIDLSRTARIDSAILANLVEAFAYARKQGADFALAHVPPAVMTLLRLSRLDRVFPMGETSTV